MRARGMAPGPPGNACCWVQLCFRAQTRAHRVTRGAPGTQGAGPGTMRPVTALGRRLAPSRSTHVAPSGFGVSPRTGCHSRGPRAFSSQPDPARRGTAKAPETTQRHQREGASPRHRRSPRAAPCAPSSAPAVARVGSAARGAQKTRGRASHRLEHGGELANGLERLLPVLCGLVGRALLASPRRRHCCPAPRLCRAAALPEEVRGRSRHFQFFFSRGIRHF